MDIIEKARELGKLIQQEESYIALQKAQADADAEDKGDHLVLRQRRHARANRQEAAGQQPAAEVTGDDGAVVRLAEVVDRQHHREGQQQR